jgi:hypothetical protein
MLPEFNQWARNVLVTTGFGLSLDRHLQRYIPPLRDSTKTVFFLATQLVAGFFLLLSAFLYLLWLVSDAVWSASALAQQCLPLKNNPNASRPSAPLSLYKKIYQIKDKTDMHEWVSIRFVVELNRCIYAIISYPLIIALLIVVSHSAYLDNWIMSIALKILITASLAMLVYLDFMLKNSADDYRTSAIKSLKQKIIAYQGGISTDQQAQKLQQLVGLIENYDDGAYRSFSQRPIFLNCLLIAIALLADSVDYGLLASKLM